MLGALLPVVAGGLAGLGGAAVSARSQERVNRQNLRIAREQMAFQRSMSNTAYTRAMADMRRAGLNPMLAYQQGGASTPGGASATMQNPVMPSVGSDIANSAMAANRHRQEMKLMRENITLTRHQQFRQQMEGNYWRARSIIESNLGMQDRASAIEVARANAALLRAGLPAAQVTGSKAAAYYKLLLSAAPSMLGLMGGAGAVGAISSARSLRAVKAAKASYKGSRGLKLRLGGSYNWPQYDRRP